MQALAHHKRHPSTMRSGKHIIIQLCTLIILWLLFTYSNATFALATWSPKAMYTTFRFHSSPNLSNIEIQIRAESTSWLLNGLQSYSWRRQLRVVDAALKFGPAMLGLVVPHIINEVEMYRMALKESKSLGPDMSYCWWYLNWRESPWLTMQTISFRGLLLLLHSASVLLVRYVNRTLAGLLITRIQPQNTRPDNKPLTIAAFDVSMAYICSIVATLVVTALMTLHNLDSVARSLEICSAICEDMRRIASASARAEARRARREARERRREHVRYPFDIVAWNLYIWFWDMWCRTCLLRLFSRYDGWWIGASLHYCHWWCAAGSEQRKSAKSWRDGVVWWNEEYLEKAVQRL